MYQFLSSRTLVHVLKYGAQVKRLRKKYLVPFYSEKLTMACMHGTRRSFPGTVLQRAVQIESRRIFDSNLTSIVTTSK